MALIGLAYAGGVAEHGCLGPQGICPWANAQLACCPDVLLGVLAWGVQACVAACQTCSASGDPAVILTRTLLAMSCIVSHRPGRFRTSRGSSGMLTT